MPVNVDDTATAVDVDRQQLTPPLNARDVTMREQLGAAFKMDNTVASTFNAMSQEKLPTPEPGFDPMKNIAPGEEMISHLFVDARSSGEMAQIRDRIANEAELRRHLGDGPVPEILASTLAILTDPISYIPYAGQAFRLGKFARVATLAGETALQVGAQEGILQATQIDRPIEESVAAMLMGATFGAGVGAVGAARVAGREKAYANATKDMTTVIRAVREEVEGAPLVPVVPDAAGAAPRPRIAPEDTELASSFGVAEFISKIGGKYLQSPGLILATSPLPSSREAVHALIDVGVVTKGHMRGITMAEEVPVELSIKQAQNVGHVEIGRILKGLHDDYKTGGGQLSKVQFNEEVAWALRRGDTHPVPQVQRAAEALRERIVNPLRDEAIKLKLLPEDVAVETAESYFTRVYDKQKMRARPAEFRGIVAQYLKGVIPLKELANVSEYDEIADMIMDKILGHGDGRTPFLKIPRVRGPLKERTFNIPDRMIERFLVNDSQRVLSYYVSTMASDIEMAKLSQRMGFGGQPNDIADKFRDKIMTEGKAEIDALPTEAERLKATKRMEDDAFMVSELTNLIRGVDRRPTDPSYMGIKRLGRIARTGVYMNTLGSVLFSSIPDMAQIVSREGFARTFGTVIADTFNGFKGIRMARKEAQMAGTALELELATRVRAGFDLGDRYATETAFERGLDVTAQYFGIATLLTPWTESMKSITSAVAGTRMLEAAEKLGAGGRLSDRDIRKLAQSGINADMARRIGKQSEHFERHGPVTIANTEAWTDPGARAAFRDALLRDVDNAVITPGRGDAPLWTSTEWGKTLFMFKRFAAASTQRVLIAGLQERDLAVLNGSLLMLGAGALGTVMREYSDNGEVKKRTALAWTNEAMDRSGLMSLFYQLDGIADKASGGNLSIQGLASGRGPLGEALSIPKSEELSRFKSTDVVEQVLGPVASKANGLARAIAGTADGSMTKADLHKIRVLAPGQNVFYIRNLLNQVEEATANRMGLPDKEQRRGNTTRTAVLPGQ